MNRIMRLLGFALLGALLLTFASAFQKMLIRTPVFELKGYIIPLSFGALYGAVIGHLWLEAVSYRDHLEELVARRTATIETQKEKLEGALQDLERYREREIFHNKRDAFKNFVSGINHGFNTPLGNLVTLESYMHKQLDALRRACDASDKEQMNALIEELQEDVRVMDGDVQAMIRLIGEIESSENLYDENALSLFHLKHFFDRVLFGYEKRFPGVRFALQTEGCERKILSYEAALERVLKHLLDNATHHAFEGVKAPTVTLRARCFDNELRLTVTDNGSGIAGEHMDKVFDPFFTTDRSSNTAGIGLYQTLNMVEGLFRGSLELKNLNPGLRIDLVLKIHTEV